MVSTIAVVGASLSSLHYAKGSIIAMSKNAIGLIFISLNVLMF